MRRKFASALMHKPLKVLCDLGGWKDPSTVLKCYQLPDQEEMREALEDRKRVAGPTEARESTAGVAQGYAEEKPRPRS